MVASQGAVSGVGRRIFTGGALENQVVRGASYRAIEAEVTGIGGGAAGLRRGDSPGLFAGNLVHDFSDQVLRRRRPASAARARSLGACLFHPAPPFSLPAESPERRLRPIRFGFPGGRFRTFF